MARLFPGFFRVTFSAFDGSDASYHEMVQVDFKGTLYPQQSDAAYALLNPDISVLCAATAFGTQPRNALLRRM